MSTRDTVYIALFAALTAALGLFPAFTLPLIAVPITAQSMGCMLAGGMVGAKRGALAMLLFVLLVAVGLPLLPGGRGGLAIFMGPGGGFILAWPLGALFIGLFQRRGLTLVSELLVMIVGGIGLVYACGIPWLAVVAGISLKQAAVAALGFLPGDLVKVVLTVIVVRAVRRAWPVAL